MTQWDMSGRMFATNTDSHKAMKLAVARRHGRA